MTFSESQWDEIRAATATLQSRLSYYGAGHGPETDAAARALVAIVDRLAPLVDPAEGSFVIDEARRALDTYRNQADTIEYLRRIGVAPA
jgi:hypothetical protein